MVICLVITFLTEMTSNTATTTLMMPILAAAAPGGRLAAGAAHGPRGHERQLRLHDARSHGPQRHYVCTGRFHHGTMASEGVVLNLLGAVVITTVLMLVL